MTSYTYQRESLLALFSKAGATAAPAMADEFLTPLAEGEKVVGEDFSSEEIALAELMAHPHTVVRATRLDVDDAVMADAYLYVAGDHYAMITSNEAGFVLSPIASLETLLDKIGDILPLRPDPDTIQTRVSLEMDDFIDVSTLLSNWDEVSAEAILEAEGMETFEAINLADSVESQEWNGLLSFMFFENGILVRDRHLWALQGPDTSWLGYLDLDTSKMVVQAANNAVLNDIAQRIWEALAES